MTKQRFCASTDVYAVSVEIDGATVNASVERESGGAPLWLACFPASALSSSAKEYARVLGEDIARRRLGGTVVWLGSEG